MAKNFSDKFIKSLKPTDKKYLLREATGFTIQVLPSGTKTFMYIYEVSGKRKYHKLGNYPSVSLEEAREKYNYAVKAQARKEPLEPTPEVIPEPAKEILTFKDVVDKYILNCRKTDVARWADIKESILVNKFASWRDRAIDSIDMDEAIDMIEDEYDIGPGSARNSYRVGHALFEYAILRRYVKHSPFDRMKKIIPSLKSVERTRFLTEKEIYTVWHGISKGGGTSSTKRALRLILLTAQRPGEVAGLHRREIDGDWWTIPAHRALKGGRDHRVYLTKTAKELIGDGTGYIFSSPVSDSKSGHVVSTTLSQQVRQSNHYGIDPFRPHDLRRTARTHMSRLKVPREHAEAVLNHAKEGMVKVYDQYEYDEEKKEVLQAWESELLRLVAHASTSE